MKTQNTKLTFEKSSVTELNDIEIMSVYGGTGAVCEFVAEYIISAAVDALVDATIDHMNNGSGYSGYMDQHGKL